MLLTLIFIIVILIILSAFFSSAETALTGTSWPLIHQLAKRGEKKAIRLLSMLEKQTSILAALLLSNNAVNVVATSLATALCIQWWGTENGVLISSIGMTITLIIFAEIIPKSLAATRPHRWALFISPIVLLLSKALYPMTFLFANLHNLVSYMLGLKKEGISGKNEIESGEELLGVIDIHGQNPENREEHVMLRSILELEAITVEDVMTHRSVVDMFNINDSMDDIIKYVVHSKHTRLPFYADNPENIIGVIHAKNVLSHLATNDTTLMSRKALIQLSKPPWFIPNTSNLQDQLLAFRRRREHVAMIIDEYSSFVGIVTLEDILEEIVGSIDDEHDIPLPGVQTLGDGSFIIDGRVTLRDISRELGWGIDCEEASTIAGYLLYKAGIIPNPHQVFVFDGFMFTIIERHKNRISKIRVKPLD